MDLLRLIERQPPQPWDHEKIPWAEPAFSQRMLREHLADSHDAASRRPEVVDRQVAWIHEAILREKPARVLDLGCGPGLYTSRLARRGHACLGLDMAPASIEYANRRAGDGEQYRLVDVRSADFGGPWDLVMMLFGEFNVFRPSDAVAILARAAAGLAPGGAVLLEVSRAEAVQALGEAPPSWSVAERGLFADHPYLMLRDSAWHPDSRASAVRYTVIDLEGASVTEYGETQVAYAPAHLDAALAEAGLVRRALETDAPAWTQSADFEFLCAVRV